jgi:trigger factor
MQITTEVVSGLERRLNITVPTERLKNQFDARLKRFAKTVKVNGFRPGKVPLSRIQAEYGQSIQQDVINDLVRDTVFEALEQEKINAVGMPNIESVDVSDAGLVYKALVEVYPEVTVNSFEGLTIERQTSSVNDADVDTMIDNLRKQRQEFSVKKNGKAADGDQVTFDFEGTIDGVLFDGGASKDFKLVIGSNKMIPGFEDGIVGMKKDEEKVIDVTFPADYQAENLAGKLAQFKINVSLIENAKLPEIDAQFLQLFGIELAPEEGGIDKLKADVRKNMEREVKSSLRNQLKQNTFDAVLAANDIEVPKAMVAEEIIRQRKMMLQQFAQQFGGAQQFDEKMLPDELFQDKSERSVKLGVLISKILADANLQVDQDRVKAMIAESAESYEDPSEVIEYYTNDKQQRAQVEAVVLEDQVIDHILAGAKVTEVAVDYQELLKRNQQQQG